MKLPVEQYRRLLAHYLSPQWPSVVTMGALLLASVGLQLVGPQLIRQFIDAATSGAPVDRLTQVALLFIALAVGQQLAAVATTYLGELVGWTATNELRADLLGHVLRLDQGFHKERTPGYLVERVDGDVTALAQFFAQFVVQVLGNALFLFGVILALTWEDWRVGLALALMTVVTFVSMQLLRGLSLPHWRAVRQARADLLGFIEERLAGTVDIRANGAVGYVMRRLALFTRQTYQTACRARVVSSTQWSFPLFLSAVTLSIMFGLSAWLYRQGALTIGGVFLVYTYTTLSLRPLWMITNQMEELEKASAGIVRIDELLKTTSALRDGADISLPSGALAVELAGATFAYEGDDVVLDDVSVRVEPGTVLGLLGRTGSGKTTIARLLFRLYDPTAGSVRLGNVDLRQACRAEVRDRVGIVTQDVQLFKASVRDNLTFFDPTVDDATITRALDRLGLGDWVRSLPDGLATLLGSGGSGLSAGQAQLLAFARVFLKDPGLVILDEASSRLDPATEALIERAVDTLLRGRTAIIIAHRLATVERADQIVLLDDGRVVEQGERRTLAADPESRFAALLRGGLERVLT